MRGTTAQMHPEESPVLGSISRPTARRPRSPGRRSRLSEDRDLGETTLATLTLLVSEVVTNAVIHPEVQDRGDIQLRARIAGDVIRVEVTDDGQGFEPRPRDPTRSDRGYGLYLVEKQAERWGVESADGTTVWFELSLRAA